jgi:uncharacterized membrane protein YfhO
VVLWRLQALDHHIITCDLILCCDVLRRLQELDLLQPLRHIFTCVLNLCCDVLWRLQELDLLQPLQHIFTCVLNLCCNIVCCGACRKWHSYILHVGLVTISDCMGHSH